MLLNCIGLLDLIISALITAKMPGKRGKGCGRGKKSSSALAASSHDSTDKDADHLLHHMNIFMQLPAELQTTGDRGSPSFPFQVLTDQERVDIEVCPATPHVL